MPTVSKWTKENILGMKEYIIIYELISYDEEYFRCHADSKEHAKEQLLNAFPRAKINSINLVTAIEG
jgi:hypothetical protein